MSKKTTTRATGGINGGVHDVRAYKKACKWLDNHTFTNAQLWHVVFKGANQIENTNRDDYETALDRLCEKLRDSGMAVEWRAAYEVDDTKGFHRHVFLLVEAAERKPVGILRHRKGGWLTEMLAGFNLEPWVARPRGDIHKTSKGFPKRHAYVPKTPGAMLDDCKDWLSYIYKVRSKAGVVGNIYSSSRKKAKKQQPAPAVQPQAECLEQAATTNNEQGDNDMNMTNLTPAGFHYLAGLYQSCVDAKMDVGAIHTHLTRKGVSVTRAEVVHHLDHVFKFDGYAKAHPAKPILTYAQADAAMRRPARQTRPETSLLARSKLAPA